MEGPAGLTVLRLHHLGVLVRELDAVIGFYTGQLGFTAGERHAAPEHDIDAVLLELGDTLVELFAPLTPDGRIAEALAKRGPGVHHVAYEVADLDAALESCRRAGIQLVDQQPRRGVHPTWRIAFLHPRSCGGVLTELVETDAPWQGVGL